MANGSLIGTAGSSGCARQAGGGSAGMYGTRARASPGIGTGGGVEPHLMVTDPPYGVEYDAGWRNGAAINRRRADGAPGRHSSNTSGLALKTTRCSDKGAEFLGYAYNGLKMLERLVKAPDQMRGLLSGFV